MRQWKTALLAFLLMGAPLAVHAAYGDDAKKNECQYDGGFWVGINYGSLNGALLQTNWALVAGYSSEWFLVDLGYNYVHANFPGSTSNGGENELLAHLGGRMRCEDSNLFATYGLLGAYRIADDAVATQNAWEAGVFVGLDYQCSQNYMIQAKLSPYTYAVDLANIKEQCVFARGSVTFAYVF